MKKTEVYTKFIFSVAADGSVTLLLPNSIDKDNGIKAEKTYSFSPDGSKIHLLAQFLPNYDKSVAEERIKVIVQQNRRKT